MKLTAITWLARAGGPLILCGSAHAAYTGLTFVYSDVYFANHPNQAVRDAWNAGPVHELNIYRLYANFNSNTPADRVNAVLGASGSALSINVINGQFHNYVEELHGETTHFHLPSGSPPQRAWDTYVTIGNAVNGGATGTTTGFGAETANLGYQTSQIGPTTNAAWFITPSQPQGQAVAIAPNQAAAPPGKYRVLIAQITVPQTATAVGVNLAINVNGSVIQNQFVPLNGFDYTPGDANGDGLVTVADLLAVISAWGRCADCSWCPADLFDASAWIYTDCMVDVQDLLLVVNNWTQ